MIPESAWRPTNAEYHAIRDRWSSSRISLFRRSPREAYETFVTRTRSSDARSTPLDIGAAVSQSLTDPTGVGQHAYRVNVRSRGSKAYKDAVRVYGGDRVVLTAPEFDAVEQMVENVLNPTTPMAEVARAMLVVGSGASEWAHTWEEMGVPCMVKLDRLVMLQRMAMVELKTSVARSPQEFSRQAWKFNYHCQAAFYRRGVTAAGELGDDERPDVYFVVIHNEWPHEVWVQAASEEFLAAGDAQIERDLTRLKGCLAGEAPWCHPWETSEILPVLRPPKWAL